MAITFPRSDIMTAVGWTDQKFDLVERQEFSRQANGTTIAKSFGSALWSGTWTSAALERDVAADFEARLRSLDGSINGFHARDILRPYPRAYPTGSFSESGVAVHTVGDDGKSLRIDGLASGFVISRGDYLSVTTLGGVILLYQAMEDATADGGGVSPSFEVRPHLHPGVAINDIVKLKSPTTVFRLVPGSIDSSMRGWSRVVVSFSGIQSI